MRASICHLAIVGATIGARATPRATSAASSRYSSRYAEALSWMDRALAVAARLPNAIRNPGLFGIASQRSCHPFRMVPRRGDARTAHAGSALAAMKTSRPRACVSGSRCCSARALNDTGRPAEADLCLAAPPRGSSASPEPSAAGGSRCERARSQILAKSGSPEAHAVLDRCLPIYRRWGMAEREIVAARSSPRPAPAPVSGSTPGRRNPSR